MILTLVGVGLFDAASIGINNVRTADAAKVAARTASEMWAATRDVQKTYDAAVSTISTETQTIDPRTFIVDSDGTVHLEVTGEATTLVLFRIGGVSHMATATSKGEARDTT